MKRIIKIIFLTYNENLVFLDSLEIKHWMYFSKIKIHDFRNFAKAEFDPNEHINVIIGENGSGKSSLLEAIGFLCKGKSFRTIHNSSIIRNDQQSFIVFGNKEPDKKIGISRDQKGNLTIQIDGNDQYKISDLAIQTPAQIIHPADANILSIGGPKTRRALIDWGTFYHKPEFYKDWQCFSKVLKQRNAFLKNRYQYDYIKYLDQELVKYAQLIKVYRDEYLNELLPIVSEIVHDFLPEYETTFEIYHGWDKKRELAEILKENYERDQIMQYTVNGPQRADLRIKCNGVLVQDLLSRGQQKMLITALKVAQGLFLEKILEKNCIFLIDDFASELDQNKREIFTKYLLTIKGQIFITVIDQSLASIFSKERSSFFELKDNNIQRN